jgi:hypothetical protein
MRQQRYDQYDRHSDEEAKTYEFHQHADRDAKHADRDAKQRLDHSKGKENGTYDDQQINHGLHLPGDLSNCGLLDFS